ncbi:MAG TPA: hypothetical protein VMF67_16860 [Rhizomicrobium sp.]|nr:hypothetical protein [Rhizomicrobium sp.]
MRVDAAQIATPDRGAVPIEEIENLDRDFAAVAKPITELRGGEQPVRCRVRDIRRDGQHLADSRSQKKLVMRDLVDASKPRGELQQSPDVTFRAVQLTRDVAGPRRTESYIAIEQKHYFAP